MKAATRTQNFGPAIPLIFLFAIGGGILSSWILNTFNLGMEISGLTQGALVYYITSMIISAGLLIAYKAPRTVGIFLAFYPFGLGGIFFVGFNSTLVDPSEAPNQLADGFAAMQVVMMQMFVWIIPAVVPSYYIYKSRLNAPKPEGK
uniref:hypothetical protein n=1 Tax=Pseudomonas sp. G.S.17 TaxID=3137451 RepID=UPI0040548C53